MANSRAKLYTGIMTAAVALLSRPVGGLPAGLSVVDLYHRLPESAISFKYRLVKKKDGWSAVVPREGRSAGAVVDIRNGYIRISDEGTGGGYREYQEIALFTADRGGFVLGVNQYGRDYGVTPPLVRVSGLEFLTLARGRWETVTLKVVPPLNPADFFTMPQDREKRARLVVVMNNLHKEYGLLSYTLPRHGTVVTIDLLETNLHCFYRNEKTGARKELIKYLCDSVKRKHMKMKWDTAKGKFLLVP